MSKEGTVAHDRGAYWSVVQHCPDFERRDRFTIGAVLFFPQEGRLYHRTLPHFRDYRTLLRVARYSESLSDDLPTWLHTAFERLQRSVGGDWSQASLAHACAVVSGRTPITLGDPLGLVIPAGTTPVDRLEDLFNLCVGLASPSLGPKPGRLVSPREAAKRVLRDFKERKLLDNAVQRPDLQVSQDGVFTSFSPDLLYLTDELHPTFIWDFTGRGKDPTEFVAKHLNVWTGEGMRIWKKGFSLTQGEQPVRAQCQHVLIGVQDESETLKEAKDWLDSEAHSNLFFGSQAKEELADKLKHARPTDQLMQRFVSGVNPPLFSAAIG